MRECPLALHPVYVEGSDRWALVDADLYSRVIAAGPWYAHRSRKATYVRSWRKGHRREYLHALVQRLRRRRRPTEDHVVRHLSGDTFDCSSANLRWGTRRRNVRDAPYREPSGGSRRGSPGEAP